MPTSLEQQNSSIQLTILVPRLSSLFFLLFFPNQLLGLGLHVKATSIFIYAGCSQEKYQPNSPYETNLHTLLSSIVSTASQSLYNSFAIGNDSSAAAPPGGSTYGLYQCRGDLKTRDCSTCISSAVNQINLVCPYTYGAALQLDGCFLRYENQDFLGKQDASLRFKRCSQGVSNDVEFLKRRDDVVADLQAGAIGFRVSTSGFVEGYSQCVGDLSEADCSSCLAEAVAQLKSLCGSSEAADVFLAQCYARYWASGYYETSSSVGSSNQDQVGKTVAIILGSVAGAAVLIVLLSFCRKANG